MIPDCSLVLSIAEKYGQSPGDVENWEERHFAAAVVLMEGQNIYQNEEIERVKKRR